MKAEGSKTDYRMYVWMLTVPLFWGGAFGAAHHVISEIPPITAAALRFALASLLLLLITQLRGEWHLEEIKKRWRGLLLMALTGIFAYNAFFFYGLTYTTAINGSLIMANSPVFITLGAVLFLKEAWNKKLGIGLLLSLTGVFLVIINGSWETLVSFTFNTGDMLFLAALLCWVLYGLLGKVVMNGVSPLLTTTVTTAAGSVLLVIWSLFEDGWRLVPQMSGQAWLEMVYMTFFATVLAFFLWNQGVHHLGASKASIYMNLVPINACWIAVLLYGASMTWIQVIGILMVIAGVCTVTLGNGKKPAGAGAEKAYKGQGRGA
ncbi:DMT family transporter [Brevibacillus ruminantium]|uniref:DMT family transporter n=1 Tax=Brevibacillus ruminantium TaxID=2950604 RepID=A0ABY4WM33_9BACL|nr:DMT family transporter [Brevibacillus ruminantium]USG68103.1 DMT family transporter [Brevibacillus ruminantium]